MGKRNGRPPWYCGAALVAFQLNRRCGVTAAQDGPLLCDGREAMCPTVMLQVAGVAEAGFVSRPSGSRLPDTSQRHSAIPLPSPFLQTDGLGASWRRPSGLPDARPLLLGLLTITLASPRRQEDRCVGIVKPLSHAPSSLLSPFPLTSPQCTAAVYMVTSPPATART